MDFGKDQMNLSKHFIGNGILYNLNLAPCTIIHGESKHSFPSPSNTII